MRFLVILVRFSRFGRICRDRAPYLKSARGAFQSSISLSLSLELYIFVSLSLKNMKELGLLSNALAPTRGTHITHP